MPTYASLRSTMVQNFGQRRCRRGSQVFHGQYLVAKLTQDPNHRGAVLPKVLER